MSGETAGPRDTDELIRSHLDLVTQVVSRVASRYPRHVDRGELWNAGALGLVEAAQRYDESTGIPFARYATIRIRGAIIDSTRSRDWASRSVRRRYREMEETAATIKGPDGGSPTREQLAVAMGITVDEVDAIRSRSAGSMLMHLDQERPEDGGTLKDTLVDPDDTVRPEIAFEQREMIGTLRDAVAALPGVHGEVVRRYYLEGELLQDIAAELGVTQARVSQIRAEALTSMRAWFGTMYEGVPDVEEDAPGKRARSAYVAALANQSTWRSRMARADDTHGHLAAGSA